MKKTIRNFTLFTFLGIFLTVAGCQSGESVPGTGKGKDPLPSWNETPRKKMILEYVEMITHRDSSAYIAPEERIAVFDNDGTLWSEQPLYFQLYFIFDRIRTLAPDHPEWKKDKLIKAVLAGDLDKVRKFGGAGVARLMALTQAGMRTEEFDRIVRQWIRAARHPVTGKPYTEMTFQPMLELIRYLQANDFKVYIVSGGGQDFMRPWTMEAYHIPREQVIGSRQKLEYRTEENGKPVLFRLPDMDFINNQENKPIAIHRFVGKRPVIAFGNSDDDLQMLQWTRWGKERSLVGFVHHTDAKREWAYNRDSHIGRLDKGLDIARKRGWLVIDMKNDWKVIHPYELKE
jgi:phosphoglycolate phosphatase-like HAD superfamily hydrolase